MYVFRFSDPCAIDGEDRRRLLGGKGAGLVEMISQLDLPVPPGFVISTDAHREYKRRDSLDFLRDELVAAVCELEATLGRGLGDPDNPLIVSVRSGAPVSMPGMMDTILNLGLTDATTLGLARQTNPVFARDCQSRLDQMFTEIVLCDVDSESPVIPDQAWDQLGLAIEAVFRSWDSPRAIAYRQAESIDEELGTAVTVQAMVFGNAGEDSGTGVVFSRDPSTGERVLFGDYLANAQGEEVVAGTHATVPVSAMNTVVPTAYEELVAIVRRLEHHYGEMCDIEFTVERGKLWILQTRIGKRSPRAAFEVAVSMATDAAFSLDRRGAISRVTVDQLEQLLEATDTVGTDADATGLGASPGTASGRAYFSADEAVEAVDRGEAVMLVRPETSPADVHGMQVAEGILTSTGGLASHAAVVARGWGIPAVVGVADMNVEDDHAVVGDKKLLEGELVSIDGTTGDVFLDTVDLRRCEVPECVEELISWADQLLNDHDAHPGPGAEPGAILAAARELVG